MSIHSIGNTSSDFSIWRWVTNSGWKWGGLRSGGSDRPTASSTVSGSARATTRRLTRETRSSKPGARALPVR